MHFLLKNKDDKYCSIDFRTNVCSAAWEDTLEKAKNTWHNPTLVRTWPVRELPDYQKISYLLANYVIIEIEHMPIITFKQLYPEYLI